MALIADPPVAIDPVEPSIDAQKDCGRSEAYRA